MANLAPSSTSTSTSAPSTISTTIKWSFKKTFIVNYYYPLAPWHSADRHSAEWHKAE